MEKRAIVYQAYGIPEVMRQTQVSILSLINVLKDKNTVDILVYTDQKEYFEKFFQKFPSVRVIEISKEQIKKWRGEIDFVHRVKIEILLDAGQRTQGPLFYSDGDTLFLEDPMDIFSEVNDRVSLMHTAESVLEDAEDALTKKIYKFTKKHHFHIGSDDAVAIGPSTTMWNAGFIGVSHKNKEFFPLILQLTDQMHALYQKHVMEQLAVSYILQIHGEIKAVDHVIHHYWDQKPAFQIAIDQFLEKHQTADAAFKKFHQFQRPPKEIIKKKKKTFWSFFK